MRGQHQGMDRPGVRQAPKGSEECGKMEETGCEIICGVPTTLAVKGQMMVIPDVLYLNDCGISIVLVVCQSVSDGCGDI